MAGRINVLQITLGMGIGGLEKVILDLCRYLDPRRFQVMVCCLREGGEYAEQLESDGFKVFLCSGKSKYGKYFVWLQVRKLLVREKIDIVHTHNTGAFLDGFLATRLTGTPVFIHTDHMREWPDKGRYMMAERVASHFTGEIVAVSQHLRDDLIKYEHISPRRIRVIYNGTNFSVNADPNNEKEIREEFGIIPEEKVVGSISRLTKVKGYELLLRSVPLVVKKIPNVKFLIVGDGKEKAKLLNLAHSLGIANKVIFTGVRLDVPSIMRIFDLFALPSRSEGLPIVLLEAMAAGKPVVATAVGGVPEAVKDGETGYLVYTREPKEFAQKIIKILLDDHLRDLMRQKAFQLYKEKFTVDKMVESYERLYEKHLYG